MTLAARLSDPVVRNSLLLLLLLSGMLLYYVRTQSAVGGRALPFNVGKYTVLKRLSKLAPNLYEGAPSSSPLERIFLREVPAKTPIVEQYSRVPLRLAQYNTTDVGGFTPPLREDGVAPPAEVEPLPFLKVIDRIEEGESVWFVLEYMDTTLRRDLNYFRTNPAHIKSLLCRLIMGIELLSRNRIILRDTRPENVYILRKRASWQVKWGEPSDAVILDALRTSSYKSWWWDVIQRTPSSGTFLPPEGDYELSPMVAPVWAYDMWGIGGIAVTLAFGFTPITARDPWIPDEMEKNASSFQKEVRNFGGDAFLSFTKELLKKNPQERMSPVEALFHDFLVPQNRTLEDFVGFTSHMRDVVMAHVREQMGAHISHCGQNHKDSVTLKSCFNSHNQKKWRLEDSNQQRCLQDIRSAQVCMRNRICNDKHLARLCSIGPAENPPEGSHTQSRSVRSANSQATLPLSQERQLPFSLPPLNCTDAQADKLGDFCRHVARYHCETVGVHFGDFSSVFPPHCCVHSQL
eukprot:CAMPEP_0177632016 /NCGR_PEP_ID=MMETSP0447-20121125/2060_1 /TAXON_ID=0 /ORGANISM="Stygamoeba regulata, Strain BSH-02190019" /LENGTH=518 /DNA_ID=CAMNT_0019133543 /DNA_START=10 /DNA_END=1562 /DNA_ORIENTATION=+